MHCGILLVLKWFVLRGVLMRDNRKSAGVAVAWRGSPWPQGPGRHGSVSI